MRSGEYEKALAVFDHALAIAPGEFGTRHSEIKILLDKARCLTALGRTGEAACNRAHDDLARSPQVDIFFAPI